MKTVTVLGLTISLEMIVILAVVAVVLYLAFWKK